MSHDVVSDALNKIMNAKRAKKQEVFVSHYSKVLLNVLKIAEKKGYIKSYSIEDKDKRLKIEIGKLNECRAIKPRFDVQIKGMEVYIRRYLPARGIGTIIVSTSSGLLTHQEAIEKNIGGSLIAYFY